MEIPLTILLALSFLYCFKLNRKFKRLEENITNIILGNVSDLHKEIESTKKLVEDLHINIVRNKK